MRDIKLEDTIYPRFTTRAFATGIPTVLAGTPVLSIYEENNLTQITSGVSVSVDYDSVVGLNQATIVATAANGYEAGKSYDLVITTGTVGGVSVVGEVVGSFSVQSAPVNWARVTAPTTAVDLSATDIQLVDTTTTNTDMRGTDSALLAASINLTAGAVDNVTTVATTTTNTDMRGTDSALLAASINLTGGAVDTVTTVGTTTTNTDMRGTDSALLAASINLTAGAVDNVTTVATTTTNTDMRGTDGANTTVPDAAGTAPTATEITTDIDANSTQLNTTIPGLIDDLAIKKNTAFSNFEFLMVLTSDHVTPATGLTVTGQRSINGGAFAGVAGAIAEVSNGIYQFDALSADTNGDVITWRFSSATADDTFLTFKTVA